jgi:hypothetical protein
LRKHNVITKKEKPIEATANRLYSFYHRNPLSTPRNLAYGYPRRIEQKIEKYGEKAVIRAPEGTVNAKDYIRNKDKQSISLILRQISEKTQVQDLHFSKRMRVGKVRDTFKYIIRPPIVTNAVMRKNAEARMSIEVRNIMDIVDIIWKARSYFYSDNVIGALIFSNAENVPNPPPLYGVEFNTYDKFAPRLHNMVKVLYSNVFNNYPDAIIEIFRIDIIISTAGKLSTLSRLRSR